MKYFPFDTLNKMVFYQTKFEETFLLVFILLVIYTLIKIFNLFDK